MLKDRSLTAYYDEVALKGLQLAANDALRGVLSDEKVHLIRDNVMALIDDLASHEDKDPHPDDKADADATATLAERAVPKPGRTEIRCSTRREPCTGVARARHRFCAWRAAGPSTRPPPPCWRNCSANTGWSAASPRTRKPRAATSVRSTPAGIAMVCISYLEISGSPNHLHYLMRRLRSRMPGVPDPGRCLARRRRRRQRQTHPQRHRRRPLHGGPQGCGRHLRDGGP